MSGTKEGGLKSKKKILEKYGEDHFRNIGKKGGSLHDGKKTAKTLIDKYGEDYFSRIGKIKSAQREIQQKDTKRKGG